MQCDVRRQDRRGEIIRRAAGRAGAGRHGAALVHGAGSARIALRAHASLASARAAMCFSRMIAGKEALALQATRALQLSFVSLILF